MRKLPYSAWIIVLNAVANIHSILRQLSGYRYGVNGLAPAYTKRRLDLDQSLFLVLLRGQFFLFDFLDASLQLVFWNIRLKCHIVIDDDGDDLDMQFTQENVDILVCQIFRNFQNFFQAKSSALTGLLCLVISLQQDYTSKLVKTQRISLQNRVIKQFYLFTHCKHVPTFTTINTLSLQHRPFIASLHAV